MNCCQRRGIFLPEIVASLPLILVIGAIGTTLTVRILRAQARVARQATQDASLADLARRLTLDAAGATTATLETKEQVTTLRFPDIAYVLRDHRVTRTQTPAGTPPVSYTWNLQNLEPRLAIESVAGRPALVWVTYLLPSLADRGPAALRRGSFAATIHAGGAP
jgi:hypothetical protein